MGVYEKMTELADGIRSKTGGTDKLSIDGMIEAVNGIPSGGVDIDALIDKSITGISSNVVEIGANVFVDCKKLVNISFPLCETIGKTAFANCEKLVEITEKQFPKVQLINSTAFQGCNMINVNLPTVKTINNSFYLCGLLQIVDLMSCESLTGPAVFVYCNDLKALILRNTEKMCTLEATAGLNASGIQKGTGYIYVPRVWLSDTDETKDYRRATNWTTFASQFRAIEDYPEICGGDS